MLSSGHEAEGFKKSGYVENTARWNTHGLAYLNQSFFRKIIEFSLDILKYRNQLSPVAIVFLYNCGNFIIHDQLLLTAALSLSLAYFSVTLSCILAIVSS